MRTILIKEYADGRDKVALDEDVEEYMSTEELIKKLKEKGMKNVGTFIKLSIFDYGVYISEWTHGIEEFHEEISYLSRFEVELICKAMGVGSAR